MKSGLTPIFRNSDEKREWEGGRKPERDYFYSPTNRLNYKKRTLVLEHTKDGRPVYRMRDTAKPTHIPADHAFDRQHRERKDDINP